MANTFFISHDGYCPCCDKNVTFSSANIWLRDNFLCSNCSSIPRERALMVIIEKFYPDWRNLKIHESSPVYRGTSKKLKDNCKDYIGSQYYPDKTLGSMVKNFRNEDLENQTFADQSFDIVVTQDVLEHLYDPARANSEIARTLKKGGAHIFTVPIMNKHKKTLVWATKGDNGEPNFRFGEEYHGNPVNPKGSPVTMHWGFDIINHIKESSGLDTVIEDIYDLNKGIWAEFNEVFVSKKH